MKETHAKEDGKILCGENAWSTASRPDHASCLNCRLILLDRLPNGPWEKWANQRENGNFCDVGHRRFCLAFGREQEPVKVLVEIDPDGLYWGWQEPRGNPEHESPSMIWDREMAFNMCFTYGVEAEVARNKGRIVRLKITVI